MSEHLFKFELGNEARSKTCGFKGIITSRADHLNGCDRYWLAPMVDKQGKLMEGSWFDEVELEIISRKKSNIINKNTGGFPSILK